MEYYTASYCAPCRMVGPIIEELQAAGWNIEKIDIEKNRTKAQEAQIQGIPTFLIYKDGQLVRRFTGARQKSGIEGELKLAMNQ
jgi:thioredoxin 1